MSSVVIRNVSSSAETAASQALRFSVLRHPWGHPLEDDSRAPDDDLIAYSRSAAESAAAATGRLFLSPDGQRAQIRGMAVAPICRHQGLGRAMLNALELRARGRGCTQIWANARSESLGFYTHAGYADVGDGPTLFDAIPHRLVRRNIDHYDYRPWHLALRPAINDDGPALAALIFGCLAEYGLAPEQDGIDRDLDDLDRSYNGGAFWVAEDSRGRILASVGMLPIGDAAYELRRMYLARDQRGSGLGRALLGTALHWARAQQARYVELETASALKTALHLYRWVGFTPVCARLETQRCDQRLGLRLV